MPKFKLLYWIIALLFTATVAPTALAQDGSPEPPPGAPGVFTERVCSGEDALVYQGVDESGAGVTTSVEDDWGCLEHAGLLVIGPWGGSQYPANAHSACYADGREDVQKLAERTGWVNGSVWFIDEENIVNGHPLVMPCGTVINGIADMGLNPHQSYVVPDQIDWPFTRATEILETGVNRSAFCISHGSEALARNVLCANWYQDFGQRVQEFMGP